MNDEVHITSLVVHAAPARCARVAGVVAAIPGAQVHATSPQGKLVVTLEAASADEILSQVAQIQRTDGVLSAALVYQCADTAAAMNEVLSDDNPPGLH